jgi:hypothetical protein
MRLQQHIYGILGAIMMTLLLASVFGLWLFWSNEHFLDNMNEVADHAEIPSPNKNYIVDSYHNYGSAISHDLTMILIRQRNESFDPQKNFCLLSMDGLKKSKVTWVSDTQISIRYEPGTVYVTAPAWKGISITYSELK